MMYCDINDAFNDFNVMNQSNTRENKDNKDNKDNNRIDANHCANCNKHITDISNYTSEAKRNNIASDNREKNIVKKKCIFNERVEYDSEYDTDGSITQYDSDSSDVYHIAKYERYNHLNVFNKFISLMITGYNNRKRDELYKHITKCNFCKKVMKNKVNIKNVRKNHKKRSRDVTDYTELRYLLGLILIGVIIVFTLDVIIKKDKRH
jgi:hypothetical protein